MLSGLWEAKERQMMFLSFLIIFNDLMRNQNFSPFPLKIFRILVVQQKKFFFKWVQPAVRHRLTYIKMFVLASSLRKPMLTSWHFGAGGDILGQRYAFFDRKMRKTGITLQNIKNPPMGRNFAWLTSERVLNKTCDATINEKIYL